MSTSLRRLEKIEAALALLQQRRRVGLFLPTDPAWSLQEIEASAADLIAKAVAAGRLDPVTQEALIVRFWTQAENDAMADKIWHPEAWEKREPEPKPPAMETIEPLPEPKPERPTKIFYPDMGII
jgi:hypothetical protein